MNLAFYAPRWPAAIAGNGIATYVDYLTCALRERGHHCFVIARLNEGDTNTYPDVYVFEPGKNDFAERLTRRIGSVFGKDTSNGNIAAADRIAKVVNQIHDEHGLDIFEIEESFGWAGAIQEQTPVPVIVRLHGPYYRGCVTEPSPQEKLRIQREGRTIAKARAITCPSAALLKTVFSHYEINDAYSREIPNPYPVIASDKRWRLETSDPNAILFVGRFDDKKGADVMLRAFERALAQNSKLTLTMVGADVGLDAGDGILLSYKEYAEKKLSPAVASKINFLGKVPRDAIDDLRRNVRVCVTASYSETYSYAVMEALALGCPTISTRTFGPPETMTDKEEMLLVDIGDDEGLAAKLLEVTSNDDLANKLSVNCLKASERLFSPSVIAHQTEQFYQDVLSRA